MYGRTARGLVLATLLSPWMAACGSAEAPGSEGMESSAAGPRYAVESWPTHTSERFGYSLRYPPGYVVLEDDLAGPWAGQHGNVVHRVRVVADAPDGSDDAALQPPAFTVEVFRNTSGVALNEWLRSDPAGEGARITATPVADRSGYLVELDRYIAPGRFYYVASGDHVYRLTPLGEHSQDVLISFVLTG